MQVVWAGALQKFLGKEYDDDVVLTHDINFDSQISEMSTSSMLSEANGGDFSRQVSYESTLSARCEFEKDDDSSSTTVSEASNRRWELWLDSCLWALHLE